jgi:hypothetical protein
MNKTYDQVFGNRSHRHPRFNEGQLVPTAVVELRSESSSSSECSDAEEEDSESEEMSTEDGGNG